MTLDEILTEYEGRWRQAMVEGTPQGRAPVGEAGQIAGGDCAWTIGTWAPRCLAAHSALPWFCPDCGAGETQLNRVLIHLNDAHLWTWDMFAGKFRDALAEGQRLARGRLMDLLAATAKALEIVEGAMSRPPRMPAFRHFCAENGEPCDCLERWYEEGERRYDAWECGDYDDDAA